MKFKVLLAFVALVALFAINATAADVNGKWTAQVQRQDGTAMTQTYTFKTDGDKLTGTVSGRMGDREIQDGKVNGDTISFVLSFDRNGETMKMKYTGKVSGDELQLKMEMPNGNTRDITAKRTTT